MDGYQYATLAAALVAPLSRGNISISSADTADQPLINPNWLTHPADQEVAVAAYKRARQVFETPVMQQGVDIGSEYFPGANVTTDAQILNLIRQSFNTVSHPSSTCKMGISNDTNAVVDTQGRVYGAQNLRVVDASIFPFLPPGLPQGTVCTYTSSFDVVEPCSDSDLTLFCSGLIASANLTYRQESWSLTRVNLDMLAEKIAEQIRNTSSTI